MFRTGVKLDDLTPDEVRSLQQLLKQLGYDPGPVDGILGNLTRTAYINYLTANGVQPSDVVDSTLGLLREGNPEAWAMVKQGTPAAPQGQQAQAPSVSAPSNAATYQPPAAPPPQLASSQPYTAPPQGTTDDEIRRLYPNLAYLLDAPEVGVILRQAATEGWDAGRLQGALYATNWWQTTSANIRTWDNKQAQDPATANAELDRKQVEIASMLARYGIGSIGDTDMRWLAGRVLREGWSDDQLLRFFGGLIRDGGHEITAGKITEEEAKIRGQARSYMVNMDQGSVREWAARIVEGTASADAVSSFLRKEASNRFHWLRSEIESGLTPEQLFSNLRNTVAQTLEISPDMIDLNAVRWSALVNPVTGDDGKMRSMNYYEAQRWARSQTEWSRTKNANDEVSERALYLLRELGAVA
jgi:peptidoglycan hydrolase-like protein with peptidoglycan-binding domain